MRKDVLSEIGQGVSRSFSGVWIEAPDYTRMLAQITSPAFSTATIELANKNPVSLIHFFAGLGFLALTSGIVSQANETRLRMLALRSGS